MTIRIGRQHLAVLFMPNDVMKKTILLFAMCALGLWAAAQRSGKTAESLEKQGLVDVRKLDKSIFVSLMYARADNFTGSVLYGDLREAYLHPQAAEALVKAQRRLKALRPDLSLKVYDAARPMTIQQRMWDKVKNTPKDFYVSDDAALAYRSRGRTGRRPSNQSSGTTQPRTPTLCDAVCRLPSASYRVVAFQLPDARAGQEILSSN